VTTTVQYAVAGDLAKPFRLARLRWPDIAEGITAKRPEWTTDRKLFDWLYESDGMWIDHEQARQIAESWGATLPD
jgi:hypothetical protein